MAVRAYRCTHGGNGGRVYCHAGLSQALLPYAADALGPVTDKAILEVQFGRRHMTYDDALHDFMAASIEIARVTLQDLSVEISLRPAVVPTASAGEPAFVEPFGSEPHANTVVDQHSMRFARRLCAEVGGVRMQNLAQARRALQRRRHRPSAFDGQRASAQFQLDRLGAGGLHRWRQADRDEPGLRTDIVG